MDWVHSLGVILAVLIGISFGYFIHKRTHVHMTGIRCPWVSPTGDICGDIFVASTEAAINLWLANHLESHRIYDFYNANVTIVDGDRLILKSYPSAKYHGVYRKVSNADNDHR